MQTITKQTIIKRAMHPYTPLPINAALSDMPLELLGGKGKSLATLIKLGLNVPEAIIFTTDLCTYYHSNHNTLPHNFDDFLRDGLSQLEQQTGQKFGDLHNAHNPLCVSVRSGAPISMPGIMDTVLNIGLGLQHKTHYEKQYKNLIIQYAEIVYDIHLFSTEEDDVDIILEEYLEEVGHAFEQDPFLQLKNAIIAVLNSANSGRVKRYQAIHNLQHPLPTAIIIQQMVMGDYQEYNEDNHACNGTGVAISRNPNNGQTGMIGEFVPHASGSDLVSGKITPLSLAYYQTQLGEHFTALQQATKNLEIYYKSIIEIEFTIAHNILYFLQVRPITVSDIATIETAMSFIDEGVLDEDAALLSVAPKMIARFLHPQIINNTNLVPCGKGIAASPGVATGFLVFTSEDAIQYVAEEKNAILIRYDTSPNDVHGMYAAKGIITARGGMTSHAAVSARGMGRPCVTGVTGLEIDSEQEKCFFKDITFQKNDLVSVDGSSGNIYAGTVPVDMPEPSDAFLKLNMLSQKKARMQVRVNADTVEELRIAEKFGYDGIGLCRTEASFLKGHSKFIIQQLIINHYLASDFGSGKKIDISVLMTEQMAYFNTLFSVVNHKAITVRLLDPPLQDIFPKTKSEIMALAEKMHIDASKLLQAIANMTENNPTIGWRGCRLGLLYPEIYRLQTEALLRSVAHWHTTTQHHVDLEIMIPFVSFVAEFITIKQQIIRVHEKLRLEFPDLPMPKIGIMIELPRAALCAGALALQADFLSFGTNDLTQTVLGISRDDAPHFMMDYLKRGLMPFDPFISMDLEGVGVLIRTAVIEARNANPNIVIGLCGEHGADPNCVNFCENIGINYLSCSSYRIVGARLAAAQSVIMQ
ncbi:MAG: pyruvate,orthophosphate dikinase [Alphaproteobacteria bacterium]|jgi:pyruvate,orthophosphate dikinase